MWIVRGFWSDRDGDIETHNRLSEIGAAAWRATLNRRGCPIVTVTRER